MLSRYLALHAINKKLIVAPITTFLTNSRLESKNDNKHKHPIIEANFEYV
ncbi:hypothetical protein QJS04_geneDACA001756 [Acorus gramineus]|uniref:Uncharacterized protein n=1 Tax=Acorus gramineus TaxID=55184 RepID=A0AAV9BHN3_ACOGR|nr:hypothetical protein QJS04_geneDACA001756 [Acorus gramineus]